MIPRIAVSGLNPAWQKTLVFQKFSAGAVNRAEKVSAMASGKGINFVRAVKNWDRAEAVVLQFAGGTSGNDLLQYLKTEGLPDVTIRTEAATRICSTHLSRETGTATEAIEPSGMILPEERSAMLESAKQEIRCSGALAVCGTYPPGIDENFYAELADYAIRSGKAVLMDAFKGIDPVLKLGITILKINGEELAKLSGTAGTLADAVQFFRRVPLKVLAITNGADDAFLVTDKGAFTISVPRLEKCVNPIGAGDTCSGVFFSEYLCGTDAAEAFALGLSAASASCLTDSPAVFDPVQVKKLRSLIQIKPQ